MTRLLLGTDEGLLALELGEGGWTHGAVLWREHAVGAIVVDSQNPRRIHVTAPGDGVYRSEDAGRTWERYLGADLTSLAIPSRAPDVIFACGAPAGVYRSTDRGSYWLPARMAAAPGREGPGPGPVACLALHPADAAVAFAGTADGGLLATTDGGVEWVRIAARGLTGAICALLVREAQDQLIAGTDTGLFVSIDSGFSWNGYGPGLEGAGATALCEVADALLAATDTGRIYRRPLGAARWWPTSDRLGGMVTGFLPSGERGVFAHTSAGSVMQSTDGGASWHLLVSSLPPITSGALVPGELE